MNAKHTPTPWRVDPENGRDVEAADCSGHICTPDACGEPFTENLLPCPDIFTASANAAFIVRAVNHHEALVEIVRLLTSDVMGDDDVNQMVNFGAAVENARALLRTLDATPPAPPHP